ncbi:GAF domain-containing protein [Aquimarina rhabdastrellae]
MNLIKQEFPLDVVISFKKFFDSYRDHLNSENSLLKARAQQILDIVAAYPELEEGLQTEEEISKFLPEIELILEDSFSSILQQNEIKVATIPFSNIVLKSTKRYKNIIAAAGKDFEPTIKNLDSEHHYIMGCSIVLGLYYGFKIDFKRPFFYDIPDAEGMMRYYRILYNADFIEIAKTTKAKEITEADVEILLDNFENIEIWKEKFPPGSWIMKGIVIANMYDATAEVSISELKTSLLRYDKDDHDFVSQFQSVFRTIFNLPELKFGYTLYNEEDKVFEKVPVNNMESYLLNHETSVCCKEALCQGSYEHLFGENTYFPISDIDKAHREYPEISLYKSLKDQGIKSAIFAPISHEGTLLGVLELVSPNKHELNSINANKLEDVIPYLLDSVLQNKSKAEDELELIIQEECTSIHPSVYWKFKREAKRIFNERSEGKSVAFKEIAFENVYPLYGQIDIKGSSEARNKAIQRDLELQLIYIAAILDEVIRHEELPIYQHLQFRIQKNLANIQKQLQVDSEQAILDFIRKEIDPLLPFFKNKNPELKKLVETYTTSLDPQIKMIYKYRKDYDESVMQINKRMASVLDKKQEEAQQMYPHYFERFKTDGVEHNMYIGESITQETSFNKLYLYNLRLWQLQVMCEMENEYYQFKKELPLALDVASMVLVFNASLSVRFRMDEKRFDVDGTYNARYEVVKKRVDKAHIKGTNKRITEKGKLVIVYSQRTDEVEYIKYINFLQEKNYLDSKIEVVELDDLQGVTGLKALRVNILYHNNDDKEYYTYEDLLKELN